MIHTYKLLSALLDYPTVETQSMLSQVSNILEEERLLPAKHIRKVTSFAEEMLNKELLDWQECYTCLFDYSSNHSLYVFDHVYGDSRKRGMAMVDLKQLYAADGLEMNSSELPDYLPVILEFIATAYTIQQGADLLAEMKRILERIHETLKDSKSPYAYLLAAVIYLASKGVVKPLTPDEEKELEQMKICESCSLHTVYEHV